MDSQSGRDQALSCCSEREQPDRAKGKGSQFNLSDLQDEGKITSIISREMAEDGGSVNMHPVGVDTQRGEKNV